MTYTRENVTIIVSSIKKFDFTFVVFYKAPHIEMVNLVCISPQMTEIISK